MDKPTFSIIIPHYNIPDLLMRCLDSIPVSDDIQVIVVDDCSPGAENYLSKYPQLSRDNLELYSTDTNGGAGKARNAGLEHACGRWIIFADADDFFTPALADLMDKYRDSDADIIYFMADRSMSDDITVRSKRYGYYIDDYLAYHDLTEMMFRNVTPWGKLYSRDFIQRNGIRFDEIPYSNDIVFTVTASCKAEKIEVDTTVAYIATERSGSLTHDYGNKPDEALTRAEATLRVIGIIHKHGYDYEYDFGTVRRIARAGDYQTIRDLYRRSAEFGITKPMFIHLLFKTGGKRVWPMLLRLIIMG